MVGGSNNDQDIETTLALLDRSLCYALSPLPEKRRAALFSQLNESALLFCGGRKSLLEINTECWAYRGVRNDSRISEYFCYGIHLKAHYFVDHLK